MELGILRVVIVAGKWALSSQSADFGSYYQAKLRPLKHISNFLCRLGGPLARYRPALGKSTRCCRSIVLVLDRGNDAPRALSAFMALPASSAQQQPPSVLNQHDQG